MVYRTDDEDNVLADYLDIVTGRDGWSDEPDVKGRHRRILNLGVSRTSDRRYLISLPGGGIYGEAVCGKCGRHGIDLSLLPDCTTGMFGTGDKL